MEYKNTKIGRKQVKERKNKPFNTYIQCVYLMYDHRLYIKDGCSRFRTLIKVFHKSPFFLLANSKRNPIVKDCMGKGLHENDIFFMSLLSVLLVLARISYNMR